MIAIVDYGRGNLFSISRALDQFGATYRVTGDPEEIAKAQRIILPGVGSFGDAMARLSEKSLASAISETAKSGTPILGICLGMQLFATQSEEFGIHSGLDLIPGSVKRLPEGAEIRIPNVGWRPLDQRQTSIESQGFTQGTMMYFVHSYAPEPDDEKDVAATIQINGVPVAAMIRRDNIIGCQFHPEKSGPAGLKLIQWFLEL